MGGWVGGGLELAWGVSGAAATLGGRGSRSHWSQPLRKTVANLAQLPPGWASLTRWASIYSEEKGQG